MIITRSKAKKYLNMAQTEINLLRDEMEALKNELNSVKNTVKDLELTVIKLKSDVAVSQQVTSLLKKEVDRQQQYTRRSCLLFKNIPTHDNETIEEVEEKVRQEISQCFSDGNLTNTVVHDLDKAHRVGPKDGVKQDIIVRFKSHSKRTLLYKNRNKNKNIKIRPSITKHRSTILYDAQQMIDPVENFDFCFCRRTWRPETPT